MERDAVVSGLALGEFAGTGPFDTAEVAMNRHEAVSDAGFGGSSEYLAHHGLAVFAGTGVNQDDVVAVRSTGGGVAHSPRMSCARCFM